MAIKSKSKSPFDCDQVQRSLSALTEYLKKEAGGGGSNALLNDETAVMLQVCSKKVAPAASARRMLKITMPHRLTPAASAEVCLFTRDVNKEERDYSVTERHFNALLARHGVTTVAQVVPMKRLRLEYQPFEAKRNLSNMYQVFLADAAVMRFLPKQLGKHFYGRAKYPHSVDLDDCYVAHSVERALRTAQCLLKSRGSSCQVTVGHTGMTPGELEANTLAAMHQLAAQLPGGVANVRNMHVRAAASPALPVYVDLAPADHAAIRLGPALRRKRKAPIAEGDEVDTIDGAKVRVTASGEIIIMPDDGSAPHNAVPAAAAVRSAEREGKAGKGKPLKKRPGKPLGKAKKMAATAAANTAKTSKSTLAVKSASPLKKSPAKISGVKRKRSLDS